jgi:hypothetical protein
MIQIGSTEALNSGAQLWFTPALSNSGWTQKIDWYLNLQLLKISQSRPASELPLMIAAEDFLPARQIIVLEENEPLAWIKKAQQIWDQMQKPSVRVFLPEGTSFADFKKKFSTQDTDALVGVVE